LHLDHPVPSSTIAALIALVDHVTTLLRSNYYVLLISMDFSKAFDSVRHFTLMEKMAALITFITGWLIISRTSMVSMRQLPHTRLSIIQGSGLGPPSYVVVASDLYALA